MLAEVLLPLVLMVLGFILLFIEVTILPGFGLVGITGAALVIAGVIVVWMHAGPLWGICSIAVAVPLFIASLVLFFKSAAAKKLVQQGKIIGDSSAVPGLTNLIGKKGTTLSPLRPSGVALIDGVRYDVMTDGGFIDKGEEVVVLRISTNSIIVDRAEE